MCDNKKSPIVFAGTVTREKNPKQITRLKHFELETVYQLRKNVGVGVLQERQIRHQLPARVVSDFLNSKATVNASETQLMSPRLTPLTSRNWSDISFRIHFSSKNLPWYLCSKYSVIRLRMSNGNRLYDMNSSTCLTCSRATAETKKKKRKLRLRIRARNAKPFRGTVGGTSPNSV